MAPSVTSPRRSRADEGEDQPAAVADDVRVEKRESIAVSNGGHAGREDTLAASASPGEPAPLPIKLTSERPPLSLTQCF